MLSSSLPSRMPGRSSFVVCVGFAVATGVLVAAVRVCALLSLDSPHLAGAVTFADVGWNVTGPQPAA